MKGTKMKNPTQLCVKVRGIITNTNWREIACSAMAANLKKEKKLNKKHLRKRKKKTGIPADCQRT